jgi:hypothetical protein
MFNTFFKRDKSNVPNTTSEVGLVENKPILLCSIATSYVYLDALCSISTGLEYKRVGPVNVVGFQEVIDRYSITLNGNSFCYLYIYAYHNEDQYSIPSPFKQLNASIDESIFVLNHEARHRYISTIADMVLTKNGIIQYQNEIWNPQKNQLLIKLRSDLGYEVELEKLIIDEYNEMKNHNSNIQKYDFIKFFVDKFHNKNLIKYTPEFIQERNNKILSAYNSIIETINRIQAWLDNELVRRRIEFNTLKSNNNLLGFYEINKCITPFCYINLGCDVFGRFNLAYGIDSRILNMVSDNMASTLLRRIYEFTPGELEPFVGFVSLDMDCIKYFENSLQNVDNENCKLIEVKRNEEKSIQDMFNNLELRDDVDEETRKWLRR